MRKLLLAWLCATLALAPAFAQQNGPGFTSSAVGTPITATRSAGGVAGTLPPGQSVVVTNVGSVAAYCQLGATATTSAQYIAPSGGIFQFQIPSGTTQIACITGSGSTTLNLVGGGGYARAMPPPGVPSGGGTFPNGFTISGAVYYAKDPQYGACVWGTAAGNDAGPCINSAYAACAANASGAGGTVIVPAGAFNVATAISNTTSGCKFSGQGGGIPRWSSVPGTYQAVTRLIWTGAAGGTLFSESGGSTGELWSVDVTGIVFDCANLANVCAEFTNVSYSTFMVGASEPRSVGVWFTTAGSTPGPGNQFNDMWLYSRSTSPSNTYSPTGILLDGGSGATFDTSYNRIHILSAWFAQGPGIVLGATDNNVIDTVVTAGNPSNDTGYPGVWADSTYVMLNGNAVGGAPHDNLVVHQGAQALIVQGFQGGSTVTFGAGNTGTAALNPVTISTNNTTALGNATLHFSSTTGVAANMTANCGGFSSGVQSNAPIASVTGSTVVLAQGAVGAVASSTPCTFTYGLTQQAAVGTYLLTAVDATHWTTTTVPAGGHTQTDIAIASGILTLTDMVLPLTGTPVGGDTITVVVPSPAINNTFEYLDLANSAQAPIYENGGAYWLTTSRNPYPVQNGGAGSISIQPLVASGQTSVVNLGGGANSATGSESAAVGGFGNTVGGFGAGAYAGHNNTVSGTYSGTVGGDTNTLSGQTSGATGTDASDRGRYGNFCQGTGEFATLGDAQDCYTALRGTGASASAFRLTANAAAAGAADCVNLPNNSGFAITITVMAFDHTTVTKNETWLNWGGLLTRGANAASTALTMQSTPTPLTNGTVSGSAIAATADTTNGCLNVSFTPPSGNTDTWNAVAYVQSIETQ